ncbi:MAG: AIR synthase family protein [Verrucomicrobia bacterium]|nr:AIR synthase family protein [Verrucomicrobiota bacterium]
MTAEANASGKVSADWFDRMIYPRLGRRRPEVLVGPRHGHDNAIVALGAGQVMAVTTDPLFIVPAYGWERAAWFAIHILLSDAATSGLQPAYATFDFNLPQDFPSEAFDKIWGVLHRECDRLGVAIVAGHTGRYDGCAFPMLGAGTIMAIGPEADYVTPAMAQVGDVIIMTKGPAIETVGQLAVMFPDRIEAALGAACRAEAIALFDQMSVVVDAMTVVGVGRRGAGVTAMHDATEFGVRGALVELASAAGVGLYIDQRKILMSDTIRDVCRLFAIDPFSTSSEGTLIVSCRPHKAAEVVARLSATGIASAIIGDVKPASDGLLWQTGQVCEPFAYPAADPFWPTLQRLMASQTESK